MSFLARASCRAAADKVVALSALLFVCSLILAGGMTASAGDGDTGGAGEVKDNPAQARIEAMDIGLEGVGDCHSQGITLTHGYLFASCVERTKRRAYVYRYELRDGWRSAEALADPDRADVTVKSMYHPSGLDHDDDCVWVASAHYRSFMARSRVACLDPASLEEVSSFQVDDHIGTLAALGDNIAAMNWDSKNIYLYSKKGELLGKHENPAGIAFQDCRGIDDRNILCSGQGKSGDGGKGRDAAAVVLLHYEPAAAKPSWTVSERTEVFNEDIALGREGFDVFDDLWLFLPGDFPEARVLGYGKP